MKDTLLVNGCSYAESWGTVYDLGPRLGCDFTVNLAQPGACNDKIFRTTLEYLLDHDNVKFVILALTFWERQEAPWLAGIGPDVYQGRWVDYGSQGITDAQAVTKYSHEFYRSYISDRFKFDIDIGYVDKLFHDLITFSGWMDSLGIKYLIFSSTGRYMSKKTKVSYHDYSKLNLINANPRVIDLVNWSSNQFLHDAGAQSCNDDLLMPPESRHYLPEEYAILNDFVYNYIQEHKLL